MDEGWYIKSRDSCDYGIADCISDALSSDFQDAETCTSSLKSKELLAGA